MEGNEKTVGKMNREIRDKEFAARAIRRRDEKGMKEENPANRWIKRDSVIAPDLRAGVTRLFIMLEHKARRAEADPGSVLKDIFQLYDPCSSLVRVNGRSINKQRLAFDQHLFSEVCDLGRAPVITRPQTDAHKDGYTLTIHTHTHTLSSPLGELLWERLLLGHERLPSNQIYKMT